MKTKQLITIRQHVSIKPLTIAVALLFVVAASRADTYYVANSGNNTILSFTSGGIGSLFANFGLSSP